MPEKWGRRFFVAGTIALLLAGLVHAASLFENPVPANETERQLMGLMSSYHFTIMGSVRSMDDFLRGFSISFMLAMFVVGMLDLLFFRHGAAILKRVALVNAVWLALMTAVVLRYFFAAPAVFIILGLVLFTLAWFKLPAGGSQS